jgi:hypothetical protein
LTTLVQFPLVWLAVEIVEVLVLTVLVPFLPVLIAVGIIELLVRVILVLFFLVLQMEVGFVRALVVTPLTPSLPISIVGPMDQKLLFVLTSESCGSAVVLADSTLVVEWVPL